MLENARDDKALNHTQWEQSAFYELFQRGAKAGAWAAKRCQEGKFVKYLYNQEETTGMYKKK